MVSNGFGCAPDRTSQLISTRRTKGAVMVALVLLGVSLVTAACSGGEASSQRKALQGLADCMTQNGLTAQLREAAGQLPEIKTQSDVPYLVSYGGGSEGVGPDQTDYPEYDQTWSDLKEPYLDDAGQLNQPVLFLGAEDHSAAFSQCLAGKAINAADLDAAFGVE